MRVEFGDPRRRVSNRAACVEAWMLRFWEVSGVLDHFVGGGRPTSARN